MCIFWDEQNPFVGATCGRPKEQPMLSAAGTILQEEIVRFNTIYPGVTMEKYVIMPNHVHLMIAIDSSNKVDGRPQVAPTVSRAIQQLKGCVSKRIGCSIWQRSFHDHIIRNEQDYCEIWDYIEENPQRWREDCFFTDFTRNDGEEGSSCGEKPVATRKDC